MKLMYHYYQNILRILGTVKVAKVWLPNLNTLLQERVKCSILLKDKLKVRCYNLIKTIFSQALNKLAKRYQRKTKKLYKIMRTQQIWLQSKTQRNKTQ